MASILHRSSPLRAQSRHQVQAQHPLLRADSGHSLRSRTNHAATMEADIQATQKLGFSLHRRMTAKSRL